MADEESIGTARIDVTINTATMDTGVDAAKRKVSGLGTEAEAQFNRANASTKRYAESLLRQAELLGKSRAEQLAYNAEVRVGGELGAKIAETVRARAAAMDQERAATARAAEAERAANALRAAAAEEADRRTQDQIALQERQWAQTRAIFADEQRLASMRADAMHAFGPELDALDAAQAQQAAEAAQAAATEEANQRLREQIALQNQQWAANKAAFADEQRLATMRADALHAFGPELDARERETAEIQRSNGVRDRLNAFLATERGQRIADAEAIRNQGKAYNDATKATDQYVMSDKARAAAMRGVPAQITDIVSGLATGQRPLTVLLQQGGQLKDMFGGVVPAVKALGSSLLSLINPITIIGGAAAILGVAWKEGSDEQAAYAKALINTGNYAGYTAQQLQQIASDMGASTGKQHDAAAALVEVTSYGKFTADQLRLVASAALAAGDGADKVVEQFSRLADDPVKASVELNSTMHYLTASVYEQILALENQGRSQDAARLAMETYSAAVVQRSSEVKSSLGLLERSWASVTGAAKGAWDAMMDVGRPQTDQAKFDVLFENRDAAKKLIDRGMGSASFYGKTAQQFYDDATKELGAMQDARVAAEKAANQKAAVQQANDAAISLSQQAQQYESDEKKRAREIAAIHQQANDAIAKANLVGDKKLANQIRTSEAAAVEGINSKAPKGRADVDAPIDVATGWKEMIDQIEKGISADKKEIEQRAKATVELNSYREAMQQRLETDKQALDLQVQSLGMGQHQIDLQRQLIDVQKAADRDLARLNEPANRSALTDDEYQARLQAIKDYEDKRTQLIYDADAKIQAAREDWTLGAKRAIADINYDASDTASGFANLVQGMYGSLSDFIVDTATTGKASVKELVSSILKEVARLEENKAAAALLTYGLNLIGASTSTPALSSSDNSAALNQSVNEDIDSYKNNLSFNAKGNVFESPDLSAYSSKVVDRPTYFRAFANGGNVMGEAGPEAIIPLTRTSDGKLGVKQVSGASDGAVSVSVVVNADGSSDISTQDDAAGFGQKLGEAVKATVKQELASALRPGGILWRAGAKA